MLSALSFFENGPLVRSRYSLRRVSDLSPFLRSLLESVKHVEKKKKILNASWQLRCSRLSVIWDSPHVSNASLPPHSIDEESTLTSGLRFSKNGKASNRQLVSSFIFSIKCRIWRDEPVKSELTNLYQILSSTKTRSRVVLIHIRSKFYSPNRRMTGSVLRNRRTNYYSHNYYNKIALQSRCRRPVSNARRDSKERNAGGLAGWRRPIVTKRGPMVHGIQFYISRVLKDERGGTKSKSKKKKKSIKELREYFRDTYL